jgi:hypothetical protein
MYVHISAVGNFIITTECIFLDKINHHPHVAFVSSFMLGWVLYKARCDSEMAREHHSIPILYENNLLLLLLQKPASDRYICIGNYGSSKMYFMHFLLRIEICCKSETK